MSEPIWIIETSKDAQPVYFRFLCHFRSIWTDLKLQTSPDDNQYRNTHNINKKAWGRKLKVKNGSFWRFFFACPCFSAPFPPVTVFGERVAAVQISKVQRIMFNLTNFSKNKRLGERNNVKTVLTEYLRANYAHCIQPKCWLSQTGHRNF